MTERNDRSRTAPPQHAPVLRQALTTIRPEEARNQPPAYFLAPCHLKPGHQILPFASDDAE